MALPLWELFPVIAGGEFPGAMLPSLSTANALQAIASTTKQNPLAVIAGGDLQKGTNGVIVPVLLGALGVLLIVVGVWSLGGGQTIAVVTKAAKAGAA